MNDIMKLSLLRNVEVRYLFASCGVRYWEDAKVNDVEDVDGTLIPCREGDRWAPLIEIDTGLIVNWKKGVVADVHYKVCDDGVYSLLDGEKQTIKKIEDGYVPAIMCPEGGGYGDYIIMKIDSDGRISGWRPTLDGLA
jgi:hypothetical protein